MKGIHASIYRSDMDCTNFGLSCKARNLKDVVVLGLDALGFTGTEIFEPTPTAPAVVIDDRGGVPGFLRARPCDANGVALPGHWMFGGNFISTSDARFPHYPVPLHDRQESAEQTAFLNR